MRSLGSLEFAKRAGKLAGASVKFAVSQATISKWRSGHRTPDERHQIQIETELGIPRDWWTQPIPADVPPDVPDEPATIADARALAREDLAIAQRITRAGLREAELEPDLQRKAAIITKLTASLQVQQRMAGTSRELDPKQILASPAWDEIEQATIAALEPWPEALEAAVAAWDRLVGA